MVFASAEQGIDEPQAPCASPYGQGPAESADRLPGGYEPLAPPKQGSFSELWKVREPAGGGVRALKRLRPEWRTEGRAMQLFRNEIEVGRAIRSRHVVRVEGPDDLPPQPYVVMEWVDGRTLEERLAGRHRPSVGQAVWIIRQCAQGLADMAREGFAHGDVKPANLLLEENGNVKLLDLGFARRLARKPGAENSGYLTGTPEYMAPEAVCSAAVDPAAGDMYSLGVTLYRLLTGRLPFRGDTADSVLRQHRSARPPRVDRFRGDVPQPLVALVDRLLAKQPLRRPESYQALLQELLAVEVATLSRRFCA